MVAERIGLFAETVVPCDQFAEIKQRPGVAEAFAARDEVDIVVTSMGDFYDEHDLLGMFLVAAGAIFVPSASAAGSEASSTGPTRQASPSRKTARRCGR